MTMTGSEASMTEAETGHHAAPVRAVKVRGVDYVAVDDLAAMFTDMARQMPEAKLAQVLTSIVAAMGARPTETSEVPEPAAQSCPGCGVRVRSYVQQDKSLPEVVLNARPVPHGRFMVSRTSSGYLAIPYDDRKHDAMGISRFREHACSGPFATPAGRPR